MSIFMSDTPTQKKPSGAWYLLPIFVCLLGGIIMYFILKDEHPKMAKKGLIVGIILSIPGIIIAIVLMGLIASAPFGMNNAFMDSAMMGITDKVFVDSTGYTPQWAMNMDPFDAAFECSDRMIDGSLNQMDDRWCIQQSNAMLSGSFP